MSNNNPRPTGTFVPMEIHEGVVPSNSVPYHTNAADRSLNSPAPAPQNDNRA